MRGGKTALASMIGVYELWDLITMEDTIDQTPSQYYKLLADQPVFVTTMAVSKDIAADGVFANMCIMIENSEWFQSWGDLVIRKNKIQSKRYNLAAQVLGSWATTAVGRSNKCVIFDELDMFEDTSGKRGARQVYTRLSKSTSTFGYDGHIVALSSPKSEEGIILELYRNKHTSPRVVAYRKPSWEMNPYLSEEDLRIEYKRDMASFYRDFACEPELSGNTQFPDGIKTSLHLRNVLESFSWKDVEFDRVLAVDPAATKDRFGMATGRIDQNDKIWVDGIGYMEKRYGESYLRESEVIDFLSIAIPKLNINTFIFDAWMFPGIVEYVDDKIGLEIIKHVVSKTEGYDKWANLQESYGESLEIVHHDIMKEEAERLQIVKRGNTHNVNHPSNGTKDISDCVANIIWYYTSDDDDMAHNSKTKHKPKPRVISSIPLRY